MNNFKICLAPLRGVTDALFRTAYAEFFSGIDSAVAPFISTTRGCRIKPSLVKDLLPENNRYMPVVPQVMSKCAENFIPLATALLDMGYETINWNLGCPYPMVAKKGRGSGMLAFPDAIERFLERVSAVLPDRLSVKMRIGRHRADEIFELMPILNAYPIREIIIHPRTGVQMYDGKPNLNVFEQCLAMSRHPVAYNGDIVDKAGFEALRSRFQGISQWMIGRGAVADPFLCGEIKGQTVDDGARTTVFRRFHDTLYRRYARKLYGPAHLLNRMKGLWGYFARSFEGGEQLRKKINKSRKTDQYETVVNHFFDDLPQWRQTSDRIAGSPRARTFHDV